MFRNVLVLIIVVVAASDALAQYRRVGPTMWERRRPDRGNLYRDTSARAKGDLLTVLIRESTDVGNSDQRQMGKNSDASYNFDVKGAGSGGGSASANFDINSKSDRNFNGNSSYQTALDFTDRITVMVQNVRPNGDLEIFGKRQVIIAGEKRTLCLTGIVRSADVGVSNTVPSNYIANLNLCYEGNGPDSHFSNQNWGARIFNKIWPF